MNFDLILNEIASVLNTTTQMVMELYPQLKTQYIWLELANSLTQISIVMVMMSILSIIGVWFWMEEVAYVGEEYKGIKWIKAILLVVLIFILLFALSLVVKPILAPDLLIIKEFFL